MYPTFFSPFCYISPLCTIFKTPGSFAPVWTIFPAPSWHREKCHCTTYGTYGTNVSMERLDQLKPGYDLHDYFLGFFLQWKKNRHNNPSPNPTVLLMWKTLHWGILDMMDWWILSTFTCDFIHFIRLWSRLFWLQIWTSTWTYILYINYTYIWSNPPTTKTPFWQTVIQHGKTSDTQG